MPFDRITKSLNCLYLDKNHICRFPPCPQVGMDRVWGRVQHLAGILRSDLAAIEGVELRDKGRRAKAAVSAAAINAALTSKAEWEG